MTVGAHLLGRLVEHDEASRDYPNLMRRVVAPRSVMHTCNAPILDQGNLGSCVGNTAAEWLNCAVAVKNRARGELMTRYRSRVYLNEADAVELYSEATQRDEDDSVEYPPTDCGTSGLGVAKALKDCGFITEYRWTFSFGAFLTALQAFPVCVGINWYSGMFDPDRAGYVVPTGSVEGGHEILARGLDYSQQRVRFRNHWGADWGAGGECWMSFDSIERLLHEDGDVMVPGLIR